MDQDKAPAKRVRDRTANAILQAARIAFTQNGYDAAGLRLIAGMAGVNVALISRYFGSKQGLFLAAVLPDLDIRRLLAGPMEAFGERAATLLEMKTGRGFDPMIAMIRAAGSADCTPALKAAVDTEVIAPLAIRLQGPDAGMRAAMIIAQMIGFDVVTRLLATREMQAGTSDARRDALAQTLQRLVDGDG